MGRRRETIRDALAARPARLNRATWRTVTAVAVLLFGLCDVAVTQVVPVAAGVSGGKATAATRVRVANQFAKLPLSFEENRGQSDARVRFLARGSSYTLFLTDQEAVFAFPSATDGTGSRTGAAEALRLRFENKNSDARVIGEDLLPNKTNYFPSGERATWHTGILNYSRVTYRGVYPGVDAVFHGNPQRLELDFDVAAGADPSRIALEVAGGRALRVDSEGNIVLGVGKQGRGGDVTLGRPVVYQQVAGVRREIPGKFVLRGRHRIGFELGRYDRMQPLVIDPSITYSTYLNGSTGVSFADAIAIDSTGAAYVLGYTTCYDFPTQNGPGGGGGFVTKFGPGGSPLVYTSFFAPGSTSINGVAGIAVDANDAAYVAFNTIDTLTTPGAYSNPNNGLTVLKLSADGSEMVYAAQIGEVRNSEVPTAIAVDSQGAAYIASVTQSNFSFPTTTGAYLTSQTCPGGPCASVGTVTKLSADGTQLVYSTFLAGSSGNDTATSIAVDSNFNAYVTGVTGSTDFPTTTGVIQSACLSQYTTDPPYCADTDAFVTELNPAGSGLVYSTFLGDAIGALGPGTPRIALDTNGNAYVSAAANSTIFANGLNETGTIAGPAENCGPNGGGACPPYGGINSFVAKIGPGGTQLLYLGWLGGYQASLPTGQENGITAVSAMAADNAGKTYLTGYTQSSYFPVTPDAYQASNGLRCLSSSGCTEVAFLSVLDTTQAGINSLSYSTYFGPATSIGYGIAADQSGDAYLAGITYSESFYTTPGAYQTACTPNSTTAGCEAAFVTEFTTATPVTAAAITAVSGGGQSAIIGTAFANPLVVNVTDSSGNPVSGVTVTFTALASGASADLSSTTATTDSSGNASVTAMANGIANSAAYQVSASVAGVRTPATFSLTNTQAATSLVVTPSPLALTYGQSVTITATISPSSVLTTSPTGYVTFYDGTTPLTPNSPVSAGSASYTVNEPSVGSHTYSAQYLGDSNFLESALTPATSTVTVSAASSGPTPVNDQETITVNDSEVVNAFTLSPVINVDGPVAFFSTGTPLGFGGQTGNQQTIAVSNIGQASMTLDSVAVSDGAPFSLSSLQCFNGATSTTLPSGGFCTMTITYAGASPTTDTGTLTFTDNAGLSNLSTAGSSPNYTQSITLNGEGSSTAPPAAPSANSPPVTENETITVNDSEVVNAFTLSPVINVGAPVAFFSTGTPLGFGGQSGSQQTIAVSNIGQATMTLDSFAISSGAPFSLSSLQCFNGATSTTLPSGGFCTLTITYAGTSPTNDTGALTFTDNATLSNLTSTASGANYMQSITLNGEGTSTAPPPPPTGTIPVPSSGPDNETITVTDNVSVTTGYTIGGTVSGLVSGQSVTLLDNGTNPLTVSANGAFTFSAILAVSASYDVKVSAQPANETCIVSNGTGNVGSANVTSVAVSCNIATTTSLTISPTPSSAGQPANFTAEVVAAAGSAAPTGTVTFGCGQSVNSGAISLSSVSGVAATASASWSTSSLPGGVYSDCFTATYSPAASSGYLPSTSASESLTVADFTLNFPVPQNLSLLPGQSVNIPLTVSSSNAPYNDPVDFAMTGLPPGFTVSFNPSTVTVGANPQTVTATITWATLQVQNRHERGSRSRAPLMLALLLVSFGPLFGLQRVRRRLRRGGWLVMLVLLAFLSLTGISSCGGGGFFNQSPQTYTVTLTATGGTAQHSITFTLTAE